jgi:hypothetical protein
LIVIVPLLAALFVVVVVVSHRAVSTFVGGGVESRTFLRALGAALEEGDTRALEVLGSGEGALARGLRAALESRREGGRASLGAREVAIEARDQASRVLMPLRMGATLGSVLGLLGALVVYLGPRPEALPLELIEQGALELDVLWRAALSLLSGLCVHAYAMQAYVTLRRDARALLEDLASLRDAVAALDLDAEPSAS